MQIHYSILKISDLAIPIHPKIGTKTSEIISSNPHGYCKELLWDIDKNFLYILEDLKEFISKHEDLKYQNISTYISNKYENSTYIKFTNKLRKFILVSLFSSEIVMKKLHLIYTISEINSLGNFYGNISEYDFLLPNYQINKNEK
tara:strand:+ start:9074 stop:9508 length:435 start_codon:yes stop_codon:yes gene_type:complete